MGLQKSRAPLVNSLRTHEMLNLFFALCAELVSEWVGLFALALSKL